MKTATRHHEQYRLVGDTVEDCTLAAEDAPVWRQVGIRSTEIRVLREQVKAGVKLAEIAARLVAAPSLARVTADTAHVRLGGLRQAKAGRHSGSASSSASNPSSE